MRILAAIIGFVFCIATTILAQSNTVQDDFEGNGTISTWEGDDCGLDIAHTNPYAQGANTSPTVLKYTDDGGQYANVRFDIEDTNFDLSTNHIFSIKIYVPSNGLTGNAPNQVSLKLQDGRLAAPWATQSEIIKPIVLNQWQTLDFNFKNDNYYNLDPNSPPPTQRTDFNRVLIQVNGENNNDHVLAYVDDVAYNGTIMVPVVPIFDSLIWSDEFNYSGALDNSKWWHQTQFPNNDGTWWNGEIQHYTNRLDNSIVENGALRLIAKRETYTDQGHTKQYTSARLNSKFAFRYGRVEIRAKLPTGGGTWPALWMLGKNITEIGAYWQVQGYGTTGWPACGEIDIMEHWGHNQNFVQSALHTPSSHGATVNHGGQIIPTASAAFHVYTAEWTPDYIRFSVDDQLHYEYNPMDKNAETWPFDDEMFFLFNIAIEPSIAPSFVQSAMEVDYIRVYQERQTSTASNTPKAQTIRAFPNPVQDRLHLVFEENTQTQVEIRLYAQDGRLVKSTTAAVQNATCTVRDLGALSEGIYTVQVMEEGAEQIAVLRFVKGK